jgi:hypothetical protein
VDVLERLEALGRRRRRQRATTVVLAVLVVAAVLGGAVLGVRTLRSADPVAGPPPAAGHEPARVVATIPLVSRPIAVATGAGALWVGSANPAWVVRIDPATGDLTSIAVPPVPAQLVATEDAVWVLCPDDGSLCGLTRRPTSWSRPSRSGGRPPPWPWGRAGSESSAPGTAP